MHFPTDRASHTTAFDGPVEDHCLGQKIAQTANASAMQGRSAMREDPNLYSRVLYQLSYVMPPTSGQCEARIRARVSCVERQTNNIPYGSISL